MHFRTLGEEGPTLNAVGLGGLLLSIQGRPPEDQAVRVIHAALTAGINFIDTADAYCLDEHDFNHNEKTIAKALRGRHEQPIVATKVGCLRPHGAWTVDGRPEVLVESTERSLDALGVDCIGLLQLYAPDRRVPLAESIGALSRLVEQGKARHIGICNCTLEQLEQARSVARIASVQNRWNVKERRPETSGMLDYCAKHGVTFLAYQPFGGTLGAPGLSTHGKIAEEARRRRMSPYRLLLAWMLSKSPVALPICGARRTESIVDSANAVKTRLTEADIKAIDAAIDSPP